MVVSLNAAKVVGRLSSASAAPYWCPEAPHRVWRQPHFPTVKLIAFRDSLCDQAVGILLYKWNALAARRATRHL